jgi:hypothetical protein
MGIMSKLLINVGLYTSICCATIFAIALRERYRANWRGPIDGIPYG